MKKRTWMIRGIIGLLSWIGFGLAAVQAQILPVDPVTRLPIAGSAVTVSIVKAGIDVTANWLPEPGETVQILVNGVGSPSISLVCPDGTTVTPCADAAAIVNPIASAALVTSAYPGQCTNFENGTLGKFASDFQLSGNALTSTDCGGIAVVRVTAAGLANPLTFVLPQDSNFNGIADIWEAFFCPGNTCPTGREDADVSAGNPNIGDGVAAFDEYRGFIVSGLHVRTDPRQKDLFIHPVNPQCGSNSFVGGGTTTYATGDTLFGAVNTLIAGARVRLLGYTPNGTNYKTDEWIDNFQSYSPATGLVFTAGTDGAVSDRRVNANAVYASAIQKGLRVIECVINDTGSVLGVATLGSPNGGDNAIIFTQRILNYYATLGATPTVTNLCYQTFQNGAWTPSAGAAISHADLIAKAISFYTAMEIGHSILLTPTVEGTSRTSYGYHHAPGTGSNLDQTMVNKSSAKCGNLFQIPAIYNTSDQTNFKFK